MTDTMDEFDRMTAAIAAEDSGASAEDVDRIRAGIEALPTPDALVRELAELDTDARLERIHKLARQLVDGDELQRQKYRNAIVDQFIRAGDWRSLLAAAKREVAEERKAAPAAVADCPYQVVDGCLHLIEPTGGTPLLARFVPKVIAETTRDDGSEITKHVRVLLTTPTGKTAEVDVPAEQLPKARGWTMRALGPAAVITPMARDEQHVATAAQYLGQERWATATEYTHTGWRSDLGTGWRYLTASGALGADGLDTSITVDLGTPRLNSYALPDPTLVEPQELADAVRASLDLIDVAPETVSVPILAAAYRAPLPVAPETSVFVVGPSGSLKTAVSALACQHFGKALDPKGLPAEWKSTSNSLEAIAHQLADVLLVIDDYAPQAAEDPRKLAVAADRIFRGAANASGRNRMRSDSVMRPAKHPRAQVLSTGEDIPPGESLRARLTIATLERGAVDLATLTTAQVSGAAGVYALAMAGYVRWLAERRDADPELQDQLREQMAARRADLATGAGHMRVPEAAAGLLVAWRTWLEYATAVQAVTKPEASRIMQRVKTAIVADMAEQAEHTRQMKVEEIYVGALAAALASGRAHLADRVSLRQPSGLVKPLACGWESQESGDLSTHWRSRGDRIGWVDSATGDVFLHPEVAYETAVAHARRAATPLSTSKNGVHKHLHEAGFLQAVTQKDGKATHLTINTRIGGVTKRVLHIRTALVTGEVASEDGAE